jgi:hypothetical protein
MIAISCWSVIASNGTVDLDQMSYRALLTRASSDSCYSPQRGTCDWRLSLRFNVQLCQSICPFPRPNPFGREWIPNRKTALFDGGAAQGRKPHYSRD